MNHLAILLTGGFVFAMVVAVAGVAYACIQLLAWAISGLLEVAYGLFVLVWNRRWGMLDADDCIGILSLLITLVVMSSFVAGALK